MHLVHGAKRKDKRNEMMTELIKAFRFSREEMDPDMLADVSVLFGDMNYRLDSTFTELES